jgi:hypothetical protein
MGDIELQEKLDSIQERTDEELNKTPAERNADEVNEYYQDFLQAKTLNENAPQQLKEAEKRYYRARYGDQYMDVQEQKYTAESRDVLESMMEVHQEQLQKLDEKIKTYTSKSTYLKNMEEIQKVWLLKTKKWVDDINRTSATLNFRNTFYTDQEQNQLSYWILFENCILISFVIVTIVLTFINKEEIKMKVIGCTALLFILFFTNTLLTWLRYLPKSVTFYTQWGYDPMESKIPWLLVVVFLLFGAICVVYIRAITEFLENMTDRWNGVPPRHVSSPDPNYPRYGRTDPRYRSPRSPYGSSPYGSSPYGTPYGSSPYGTPYGSSPYGTPYGPRSPRSPYGTPYGPRSPRSPYGTPYADPRWSPSREELLRRRDLLRRR